MRLMKPNVHIAVMNSANVDEEQGVFEDFLLGAVGRRDFGKVLEVATTYLNWQNPYWNSFHHPLHLAGWLLTNLHCAYCGADLLEEQIPARRAHTDHLLPQHKYPHLQERSMMNAVASCDVCNCQKGGWDPNSEGGEQVYHEGELTYDARLVLIERTKLELSQMPRPSRTRVLNMEKVRAAAGRAREMLA